LINVPNKDCAAAVIHEGFDPIPDMGRSIDSSMFVMRHATFDATNSLQHIGPTLDRRHLAGERNGIRWYRDPYIACRLDSQRALYDPAPKILLLRNPRNVAACAQQARSQHRYEAPPCHTHVYAPTLVYPGYPAESTN
jgi:hypothetical protein